MFGPDHNPLWGIVGMMLHQPRFHGCGARWNKLHGQPEFLSGFGPSLPYIVRTDRAFDLYTGGEVGFNQTVREAVGVFAIPNGCPANE